MLQMCFKFTHLVTISAGFHLISLITFSICPKYFLYIITAQVCWQWIFFSFCVPEKVFISLSFLKDIFTGYRILHWWYFSFHTLIMTCHCCLACIVFEEKSAVILIFIPLYLICVSLNSGYFSDFLLSPVLSNWL